MLKPLGTRVLIQPDEQPEASESGLIHLPQDRDHVAAAGTVVAVGDGSGMLWKARTDAIDMCIDALGDRESRRVLFDLRASKMPPVPSVKVGDRVVVPIDAGLDISEDGIAYILVNEDDLVVIVEENEVAA